MNPDPPKFQQQQRQQQEQHAEVNQVQQKQAGQEFASVEEMLRLDARQNPPPPTVAKRLNDSIAREPKPRRSWWQRLFSQRSSEP
ncbi:MAG: hypothetical protein HY674_20830 [Chloroflexi bacterium]|nr:hypothetical protein [Chloroflexota bacterium]